MKTKTLCMTFAVLGLLAAVAPAWGQGRYRSGMADRDGAFRVRLGAFRPDGNSEYWDDKAEEFTGDVGDLENVSFGAEYLLNLSRHTGLLFSGSVFEGDNTQSYRDFVDNFGDRIRHDTTLSLATATVGAVFHFAPEAAISPYLGVGGGAYFWSLEEDGDFIDFRPNPDEIFTATLETEGVTFGYYWLAGLEAPITDRMSLYAEGRWSRAEDELSDDFENFGDIDLSGREYAFGISWNL